MLDVPDEICREILSRLPVTPLLRLRCVSKSWKILIDSDEFIKQHMDHSRKTNTKLRIIILRGCFDLCFADFDLLNQTNRASFQELSHPLKKPYAGTKIVGSCDGLLALKDHHEEDDIIIWNPSIRRFHKVPYTPIEYPEFVFGYDKIVYGIGYDVVSNDYKFVRMVQYYEDYKGNIETEVKVYSLKFDSWRVVPEFPYRLMYKWTHGEFVNGALHWIVTRKVKSETDSLVAAFDLGTEEYRLVPLPERFAGDDIYMDVAVLGGCLGLVCFDNEEDRGVDVWVMKEYGVQESWSILFTFDICDIHSMRPLAYSKCGRKVLVGMALGVMWYDLHTKSTDLQTVQMRLKDSFQSYTCLQSLVLIDSGTCDFDLFTEKNKRMEGQIDKFNTKDLNDEGAGEPEGL